MNAAQQTPYHVVIDSLTHDILRKVRDKLTKLKSIFALKGHISNSLDGYVCYATIRLLFPVAKRLLLTPNQ